MPEFFLFEDAGMKLTLVAGAGNPEVPVLYGGFVLHPALRADGGAE